MSWAAYLSFVSRVSNRGLENWWKTGETLVGVRHAPGQNACLTDLRVQHTQQKVNNDKTQKKKTPDWVWALGYLGYLGAVSHFCCELRAIFAILFAWLARCDAAAYHII